MDHLSEQINNKIHEFAKKLYPPSIPGKKVKLDSANIRNMLQNKHLKDIFDFKISICYKEKAIFKNPNDILNCLFAYDDDVKCRSFYRAVFEDALNETTLEGGSNESNRWEFKNKLSTLIDTPISKYLSSTYYTLKIDSSRRWKADYVVADFEYTPIDSSLVKVPAFNGQNLRKHFEQGFAKSTFLLCDNFDRAILRGEEKERVEDMPNAIKELTEKFTYLSSSQYGQIDSIFGYALGGSLLRLYTIDLPRQSKTDPTERIALVIHLMAITDVGNQICNRFRPTQEYIRFVEIFGTTRLTEQTGVTVRQDIEFDFSLNRVTKIVFSPHKRFSPVHLLESFYSRVIVGRQKHTDTPIKYTSKCLAFHYDRNKNMLMTVTTPLGEPYKAYRKQINSSLAEFEKCILCVMEAVLSMHDNGFVHGNVKWNNIVYDRAADVYLLIDFEEIYVLDNHNQSGAFEFSRPAVRDAESIVKLFRDGPRVRVLKQLNAYTEFICFATLIKTCAESLTNEQKYDEIKRLFWKFYRQNIRKLIPDMTDDQINMKEINCKF